MRSLPLNVGIGLLSLAVLVRCDYDPFDYSNEASLPGGNPNSSLTEPVTHPLKYNFWYKDFRPQLTLISDGVCNLSLKAYRGDPEARETLGPVRSYCWSHADCILSECSERVKASFGGTSILLGMAPTTLSVLGPSVAEMALLSLHRPILSFFLSLGAPAVFPGRFLLWDDPLRANEPATGAFVVQPFTKKWALVVSILQYLLAATACGNIIHATYSVGIRSIISWDCNASYWPLVWVLASLAIHLTATLSLRLAIQRKKDIVAPRRNQYIMSTMDPRDDLKTHGLRGILRNEVMPSANSDWQVHDLYDVKVGPVAVILQYTGAFTSVCHLVFGTLLFSSLQFIGVGDAVGLILRLIASATVCRVILQFEVGGMIKVDEGRVYRGIVQAPKPDKAE